MLCYISLPNEQCLEIEVDTKQTGRVVLDKVLEKLGVLEADYFGLQYRSSRNESLWLNLRNRLCDHEIHGPAHVYRLSLRVKFFVQPHTIQQEITKELFYNQVKYMMSNGLFPLETDDCDESRLTKIVANICQVDNGDQTCNVYQTTLYMEILQSICPSEREPSPAFIEQISKEHSKLRGKTRSSALYSALSTISPLPSYGCELHRATSVSGADVTFAVGPEGIVILNRKTSKTRSVPYSQIRLATHNEKCVHIELIDDFGEPQTTESFKLRSKKAAVALYRCITEMHSFFRCDTVGSNVQSQYCRDFKGTFVSIFNENSELGKRYMFDIQRTRQEAYDLVRRKLYTKLNTPLASPTHCPQSFGQVWDKNDNSLDLENTCEDECPEVNGNNPLPDDGSCADVATLVQLNKNRQKEVKKLKRRIEQMENSLTCCICMDKEICMALYPCGHMTCDDCSSRIEQCPQCRQSVKCSQRIYLNLNLSSGSKVSKESGHVI